MGEFHYVYILESQELPPHFYIGLTDDLRGRLGRHHRGEVAHTAKFVFR